MLSCIGFARRWLIAIAFWLSGGFIKSGLGNRVAYAIVAAFGKTTLGLAYSLVFAEALLAPAIPSVAARAGGIFFPLVKALCLACGSDPVLLPANQLLFIDSQSLIRPLPLATQSEMVILT